MEVEFTTRLNYLTVQFQGRAIDSHQTPPKRRWAEDTVVLSVGACVGRDVGLARRGQVWPGAPGPVGRPWEPDAEPTGE